MLMETWEQHGSMEMQALWFGENEKSYFNFDDLNKNRKVAKAFYPSELAEHINDKKLAIKKEIGEIRIISADIATKGGSANDATAIFCARLIPTNDGYERHVVYTEAFDGGIVTEQGLRINQLFHEFSADYLVLDTLNAGIFLLDILGQGQTDIRTGQDYPPLKCMNDDDLAKRCVYPNAQKAIYSIQGTAKLNNKIAVSMRSALRNKKLKLMMHENDAEEVLETFRGYKNLPEDIKMKFKMPFIQTSLLINETINLEATYNDQGEVTLKEIGSARKDRYSSLSYLNYFVSHYLEPKNRKVKQTFDPTQLFMYKKPKLY